MSPLPVPGVLQRRPVDPAEALLLAGVRAGGAAFRQVVFTRNRRVMVSTGDGGKTLRLNERFREAPPEVLRAIGCVLSKRSPRLREPAKTVILAFLRANPPAPAIAGRRAPPGDRQEIARLAAEFHRVNETFFGGSLPAIPIVLSGRLRRRNGHFSTHPLEIVISRALCRDAEHGEAEQTLRHEMIHLWQHQQGHKLGHGRDFRRWAERLSVHPRATRSVSWKCEAA